MGLHVFEVTLGAFVCSVFLSGISLFLSDWLGVAFVLSCRGSSQWISSSCSNHESSDPICAKGSRLTSGEGFEPPPRDLPISDLAIPVACYWYPFDCYCGATMMVDSALLKGFPQTLVAELRSVLPRFSPFLSLYFPKNCILNEKCQRIIQRICCRAIGWGSD